MACCPARARAMAEPLLAVRGLTKRFGGLVATDGVDLEVADGETLAVIGPNGAGKTTLIGQLSGDLVPDAGTIRFAGRSEEHTSELQSRLHLVCRLLLEKKKKQLRYNSNEPTTNLATSTP